jgi:hypothetical protein
VAELPANQKIEPIEKRFGNLQGEARVRAEEDSARAAMRFALERDDLQRSHLLGVRELLRHANLKVTWSKL